MSFPVLLLYVYGVVLIIGGIMGYVKAGSIPSLIAGCICGVIALLLGYYYATWHFAPHAALLLSILLILIMGRRYLRTRRAMPAVLVVVLSLIVAVTQVFILLTVG